MEPTRNTFNLNATWPPLACPNPEKAAFGLQELQVNAIEHGNLEIQRTALEPRTSASPVDGLADL